MSRASPDHTVMRNCTRDEGGPFGFGNQVPISSHRKLLRSKAVVVNVAEKAGRDPVRYGSERRAQANRCRRFADILADICARLDAVRYSFIVVDLHHLLLAGLPAHPCENANALADFIRECEHRGRDVEAKSLGSRERR